MKNKVCTKCGEEKELSFFGLRNDTKDGYQSQCKVCVNKRIKKYRQENPSISKKYREAHKDQRNTYRELNKERIKAKNQEWYVKNKEKSLERSKNWNKNNRGKANESSKKSLQKRRNTDPIFKFKDKLRSIINKSIKQNNYTKNSRTQEILGCSYEFFISYIESKFEPWMTWENRGLYNGEPNYGWDIDHIIPLSTATTEEELLKLNHYTNLQPLCSHYNRYIKKDN